jgi:hypothetical protein
VRFEHGLELAADYWEFIQCAPAELELEINQVRFDLCNKREREILMFEYWLGLC